MIKMAARKTYRKASLAQRAAAAERRDGILNELAAGIADLTTTEAWQRYLDVQSRFHRYSFANTMLIMMQCPGATAVMPYGNAEKQTGWLGIGRQVRKGETGIRIWAPSTRKLDPAADRLKVIGPDGKLAKTEVLTGFRLVSVFDVSQTDGEPLPKPNRLLDGDDPAGLFAQLMDVAIELGFSVQVTPEIAGRPGANGICVFVGESGAEITVAGSRSPAQKVKSEVHEIAHALLHNGSIITRGLKELEAESVAYVVCKYLGLDTSDYSFGYVAGWKGGDAEQAREAIKASGQRISGASKQILDGLEAEREVEADRELEMA